jgi:RNA polymerase sigma factor (sigma-70 family)
MPPLLELNRSHATDSPNEATERNIEIATAYALRAAERVKYRAPTWMDKDAFDEAVILAVMRTAKNYRTDKKTSFFTYAHSMVNGALREEWRKQMRKPPALSLDDFIGVCGIQVSQSNAGLTDQHRYVDILEDRNTDLEGESVNLALFDAIHESAQQVLTEREYKVYNLRFLQQCRQNDVAQAIGVTPSRVNQIEGDIIRKLKKALNVDAENPLLDRLAPAD